MSLPPVPDLPDLKKEYPLENTLMEPTVAPPLVAQSGQSDHPVIDIPFTCEIDGRQYRGEGLSLVNAGISGLIDPQLEGAKRLARLVFAFDGFTVALSAQCNVHGIDKANGRASLLFVDPAGPHLPQLRHLLNSFIAGDLVSLGQTIGVALAVPAKARPKAPTRAGSGVTVSRVLGNLGLAALTVALVTMVSNVVFDRAFTTPVATPARISLAGQTLAAITSGQIDYINADAAPGEVAFSIRANSGEVLSIAMPCDCTTRLAGLAVGATVFAGDPILYLSQPDAALVISGLIARQDLLALARADHVLVRFSDGTTARASFDPASLPGLTGTNATAEVPVLLTPETPLPASYDGQLAELLIMKPVPQILAPLAALRALTARVSLGAQS